MDNRIVKLLTEEKSVNDVNLNAQGYVSIDNTSRPLHLNDLDTIVSEREQADKERQESTIYRFYGSIKPVISNPLYNKNIKIFLEKQLNGNVISTVVPNNTKTVPVQSPDIVEKDGWFGYYDDVPLEAQSFNKSANQINDNKSSLCEFIPFDPGYDRLRFLDNDGQANYQLKITYPAYHRDDIALVTNGNTSVNLSEGIPVVRKTSVKINDRVYTSFETAINHGVRVGDFVTLKNFTDITNGELALTTRLFKVMKLGDNKTKVFILDINPDEIQLNLGSSTFKRVVNDIESSYYMRVFSAITNNQTDYDVFPAAFAKNAYSDPEAAFSFIKDVDLSPNKYRDNLGRPLSEVYLTITKLRNDVSGTLQSDYWNNVTNNADFWTNITPGFITAKHERVNYNIRAFNDTDYNQTYFNDVNENDTEYVGDIVEYNTEELEERKLEISYHRINTEYRENRSLYTPYEQLDDLKEGYIYSPHYRIKIRDFSAYIESGKECPTGNTVEGCVNTINIPDYATLSYSSTTGVVVKKWKDYLPLGTFDEAGRGAEYPFESGAHYVFLSNRFYLRRQDPPCDLKFTDLTFILPGQEKELAIKLSDPNFVQIISAIPITPLPNTVPDVVDFIPTITGIPSPPTPQFDVSYKIRMVDYYGDYSLGPREVPGACVYIGLIKVRDIDAIC